MNVFTQMMGVFTMKRLFEPKGGAYNKKVWMTLLRVLAVGAAACALIFTFFMYVDSGSNHLIKVNGVLYEKSQKYTDERPEGFDFIGGAVPVEDLSQTDAAIATELPGLYMVYADKTNDKMIYVSHGGGKYYRYYKD